MATSYENYSSSSDESDFQPVQGDIVPYRFEPVYSREDVEKRQRENEERVASPSDVEATEGEQSGRPTSPTLGRTEDKFWCTCKLCALMPTIDECICCHEVQQARALVDKFDPEQDLSISGEVSTRQQKCVTQHPDFEAHLNEGVLDTYFRSHKNNWKRFPKPRGPRGTLTNAQYRLVAYRFILDWLLQGEILGRKKRIPLPACVVYTIRQKYPADNDEYSGFKYAELHTI